MEATDPRRMRVLLTGDLEHSEFAQLCAWLPDQADVETDQRVGAFDVIIICQSRPGQFSQTFVESRYRRAPLAHLLVVLGSWCEGESRSGQPWHGVERVYWYEAIGRLSNILHRGWASDRTEAPADRIQRQCREWPTLDSSQSAVIITRRRTDFEALADACQAFGFVPRWQSKPSEVQASAPDLVLISADDLSCVGSLDELAQLRRKWSTARFIAMLNFPRHDEVVALQAAGCDAVVGKPLLLSDLFVS